MSKIWTIKEILTWTCNYFKEKNIDAPRLTAEILLAKALQKSRLYLYTNFSQPLNKKELSRYKALITRRAKGEPTSYITGEKEFWSLTFKVNKHVLIPRPETEILVEKITDYFKNNKKNLKILEMGTGSGNIAVAIAKELENSTVYTVDKSFNALKTAIENIKKHNCIENIHVINCNLDSCLKNIRIFDAIVSNPPYITNKEFEQLQTEIKKFEPLSALVCGDDMLFFYKKIIKSAQNILKKKGMLFLEFGTPGQGEKINELLKSSGFGDIKIFNDYSKTPRVISARFQ
jgi:release factor glutamine methyltransferase